MGVLIEINAGPMAGKVIGLKTGETVTFGRAAGRAQFALPHDTFMSGVHFAVECGASGCRVQDRKSSNGTFLNGAKIQDAMLANGDEIKGGQTVFSVKIVADAKLASLVPPQSTTSTSTAERRRRPVQPVAPSEKPSRPSVRADGVPGDAKPEAEKAATPRSVLPKTPAAPSSEAQPGSVPAKADSIAKADPIAKPPAQPKLTANPSDDSIDPAPDRESSSEWKVRILPDGPAESPEAASAAPAPPSQQARKAAEEPPHLHAIPKTPSDVAPAPKPPTQAPRANEPQPNVLAPRPPKSAEPAVSRGRENSRHSAFSVSGWTFPAPPPEWQVQEGFGFQQSGHEEFPSSVAASEELLVGITLQQFVESQISMLRRYLRDPQIEPTMPPSVGGAQESMAVNVRHSTKDGRELVYRRIYARSGSSVGVLTVTTLAADLPQILKSLQPLLDGAAFRATHPNN